MGDFRILMREKSGKKLAAFSVLVFLLITIIVFFVVLRFYWMINLNRIDDYLGEIPALIAIREKELNMRSRIYRDDIMTRAELGAKLYDEANMLADSEKLERARTAISADSISLLDEHGELLCTTGHVSPEENFRACIKSLEPGVPDWELYPAVSKDGKETGKKDAEGFVRLPLPGDTNRSLVFEFSCETLLELYNALDDWPNILERMLSGEDGLAFAKTGSRMAGYPMDSFTSEQTAQLYAKAAKVLQNSNSFLKTRSGRPVKFVTLLGEYCVAVLMHYSHAVYEDTDILLTAPLGNVLGNSIYIAAAISALIGLGIMLVQLYIFRRLLREEVKRNAASVSLKLVCQATWPGMLVVVAVTVLFSCMLLLLENRSNISFTAMSKRRAIQYDIDWYKSQEGIIRRTFENFYRERTQILADFLTGHPDYQTHAGMKELNRIAKADYLMRFDRTGREVLSSNSYTGFSVGTNLSEKYRGVLMGYPYVVAGPAADPYTGQMQLGTAILITDSEEKPDGFLLAVYNAGELTAELARMSYERAVNSSVVQKGHIVAAINDEDGRFIAHTDPKVIGLKAEDFLDDVEAGSNFEGFTEYKGEDVCVSASSSGGRTLLYVVPERWDFGAYTDVVLAALAVLVLLAVLYYPIAGLLIARAAAGNERELQSQDMERSPIMVFFYGYAAFLTLFAFIAFIACYNGWWASFDYLFGGQWSKGIHLFSIWAALFILALTLCCGFLVHTALKHWENSVSLQSRTGIRLVNSLITYVISILFIFCVLDMFGVNTIALLTSASVIPIALGMGAQSMAADLLAGFFMTLGGSVHVGDYINAGGITGRVTDMGIRVIKIIDDDGNVVLLNNSKVTPVRNMGRAGTKEETAQSNKK